MQKQANDAVITVDLHGKSVFQSRVCLESALRRAGGAYRIRVVHGHHCGTALRELVRGEFAADDRVIRTVNLNEGMTDLILREL